jgi:hypothetical protein
MIKVGQVRLTKSGVGTPVGTMRPLLGHSTPEITHEIYLHAIPEEQRRTVGECRATGIWT